MSFGVVTAKLAINNDLRYHSCKRSKEQLLIATARSSRLKKAKRFLNKLIHSVKPVLIFFSDEKNFRPDQLRNAQNNRWLAVNPCEVSRVMKTKFPQTVMAFGYVSSDGDVMLPHVFEEGLEAQLRWPLAMWNCSARW